MQISKKDWQNYINKMSALSQTAGEKLQEWVNKNGLDDVNKLIKYSHALVTKYGEGASELACNMYDAMADIAEASVKSAIPAEVATFNETAKAIQGSLLRSPEGRLLSSVAQRLVKQAGADTMLKNAVRDKAQWAWIPSGDTCPFCITLASRGWQRASEKQLNGGHAEHIHANCNCQFAIRFSENDNVKGYDPEKYRQMYESAEGGSSKAKINAMRREKYAEKKITLLSSRNTDLKNEFVGKSVGAKFENLDIMDLASGEKYHLAEGTFLRDKHVFAGKGSKTEYRDAYKYAERYGGEIKDWQHVKGYGTLSTPDGDFDAEIHWSQCEGIGKKELFIKQWLE